MLDRRKFLVAGMGFAAAPLLARAADIQTEARVGAKPIAVRAYGAKSATSPLEPLQIERRAIGPNDLLLDVLYCSICHSDIHTVRDRYRFVIDFASSKATA